MPALFSPALSEVAVVALRLGCTAFGGPAVHIALLEEEIVRRRSWMTSGEFLDFLGATNLIPGPNSTEMVMHAGRERAGLAGLVVAGVCFIAPAALLTAVVAWAYVRYGTLPAMDAVFYGLKPAVLAIILGAAVRLGRTAWNTPVMQLFGALAFIAALLGVHEIAVLFGCGLLGALFTSKGRLFGFVPVLLWQVVASSPGWGGIAWIFFKIGALLYGSGYVLYAFLEAELVAPGYLSATQMLDAVAVGQFTPGPLLATAAFLGYLLGGAWGAFVATVAIFLPAFIYVAVVGPWVPRLRQSAVFSAFLNAVNAAAVALIAAVCVPLGRTAIVDVYSALIALLALAAVFSGKKVNSAWILAGGAAAGFLVNFVK